MSTNQGNTFNTVVYATPSDLPAIGITADEIRHRLDAVEASVNAHPENFTAGWGYRLAKSNFMAIWDNVDEWFFLISDLNGHHEAVSIAVAVERIFSFVSKGRQEDRMLKGLIAGVFDEPAENGQTARWYNIPRLAELIGTQDTEQVDALVTTHDSICNNTDPINRFTITLLAYGDFKNSSWEMFYY